MASDSASSSPVKSTHKGNAGHFPDPEVRRAADQVHLLMEREMRSQWVGPMSVNDFFKEFMSVPKEFQVICPQFDEKMFKDVSTMKRESAMYNKWLEIMSSKGNQFLPGYKLVNTSSKPDVFGDQLWRIDLTCYHEDVNVTEHANQLDKAEWGIEFKRSDSDDPFGDKENFVDYELDTPAGKQAKETRGQLAMYAAEWFSHQHRTHMFSIFISKTRARFLYFDRSGVVVTDSFNYAEDATPIVRFMWYFSSLTPKQKGFDTTVREATSDQAKEYRDKLMTFHKRVAMLEVEPEVLGKLKDRKKEILEEEEAKKQSSGAGATAAVKNENTEGLSSGDDLTDADWDILWDDMESSIQDSLSQDNLKKVDDMVQQRMPCATRAVVVIQVPCDGGYREVIGQGFSSSAESLVGRSTRAWPVWDPVLKKLLYLKDSWRSCLPKMQKESCILKELNLAGVNHVPVHICGGDVANQITRTVELAKKDWVYGEVLVTPRAHHRFLVDFIGRSVKHFSHSKQMLQAVYDAFNAHREAWEKCDILHRDISANNVMLDRWGRGVLNDWDLSKKENDSNIGPRTHARTGTWYFMSTLLLQNPGKKHGVYDDLESFVLLVLYLVLSYLDHTHKSALGQFMYEFFEECTVDHYNKTLVGGDRKLSIFLQSRRFVHDFKVNNNNPLHTWMKAALLAVCDWVEGHRKNLNAILYGGVEKDLSDLQLYNHNYLSTLFQTALDSTEWPEGIDKSNNRVIGVDGMYIRPRGSSDSSNRNKRSFNEVKGPRRSSRKRAKNSSDVQTMDILPEGEEDS